MKYVVEMDSAAMMYIPSVIKIDSVIQKLMDTQTAWWLRGFSPQVNYTDRATAACRRS
jgi:hypothetical protein